MERRGALGRVDRALGRSVPVCAGLAALAVSQPLLDLFGRHPTFFVARAATDGEILALGCLVAIVPALAAIGVVALGAAAHERVGDATHHLVVVLLGSLLACSVLVPRSSGGLLLVTGAVAVGALLAIGEAHTRGLRAAFDCLTPLPIVVLAVFAFTSPTARLVWQPAAAAGPAHQVDRPADVVLLVLDELPLASLLRADGQIHAGRFPNFARLAASGTWYRNASSSYARTEDAVPSLLSGRRPPIGAIPNTADHPRNLFTLLAGTYRMNVVEEVTDLCPPEVCGAEGQGGGEGVGGGATGSGPLGALRDAAVVFGHQVVPAPWSDHLPVIGRSWGDFGASTEPADRSSRPRGDAAGARALADSVPLAWRMLRRMQPGEGPSLDVAHVVFPHAPWTLTPDGHEYGATLEGLAFEPEERWTGDEAVVRRGHARHLLQVGYADALLGRLLDRLERQDRLDDTLVAVVADHGAAFTPGGLRREPSGDDQEEISNHEEIFRVPMIIKAPRQAVGRVDDRPAQTVDLVPTLVDLLGVHTEWAFDGVALLPGGPRPDPVVLLTSPASPQPFTAGVAPLLALARRNARRFPDPGGWRGVFASGPLGAHLGRTTSSLEPAAGPSPWTWSSPDLQALRTVDRDGPYLPVQVSGTLRAADGSVPPGQVLVALDGTVAGVGDVAADGDGGWRFLVLLDPAQLHDGANRLSLHVPDRTGDRFVRARPAHPSRPALGRDAVVIDGRELPLTRPDAAERLEVTRSHVDEESITIEGLAVSPERTLPADLVLFVDERPVSVGPDPSPAVTGAGGDRERWEFVLRVSRDQVGDATLGTLVAIYPDHGVAVQVAWR